MPGKKILVIDDDKAIHSIFRALLAGEGHQVLAALDAMQGLMLTRQNQPDLVVLDMNMPAGGGISVYERLRTLSGTFQTPVLIYTAAPLEQVRSLIPDGLSVAFLSKPQSASELKAAVERMLAPGFK